MEAVPQDHLALLRQLALEYQKKHDELEKNLDGAAFDEILQRLKALGELTTDRFRMAQHFLLGALHHEKPGEEDELLRSAAVLCRCFDEMRILFQVLLERSAGRVE